VRFVYSGADFSRSVLRSGLPERVDDFRIRSAHIRRVALPRAVDRSLVADTHALAAACIPRPRPENERGPDTIGILLGAIGPVGFLWGGDWFGRPIRLIFGVLWFAARVLWGEPARRVLQQQQLTAQRALTQRVVTSILVVVGTFLLIAFFGIDIRHTSTSARPGGASGVHTKCFLAKARPDPDFR